MGKFILVLIGLTGLIAIYCAFDMLKQTNKIKDDE